MPHDGPAAAGPHADPRGSPPERHYGAPDTPPLRSAAPFAAPAGHGAYRTRRDGAASPPRLARGLDRRPHACRIVDPLASSRPASSLALLLLGRRGDRPLHPIRGRICRLPPPAHLRTGAGVPRPSDSRRRSSAALRDLRSRLAVRLPRIPSMVLSPRHPAALRRRGPIWEHRDCRTLHPLLEDRRHSAPHGRPPQASGHAAGAGRVRRVVQCASTSSVTGRSNTARCLPPRAPASAANGKSEFRVARDDPARRRLPWPEASAPRHVEARGVDRSHPARAGPPTVQGRVCPPSVSSRSLLRPHRIHLAHAPHECADIQHFSLVAPREMPRRNSLDRYSVNGAAPPRTARPGGGWRP